MKVIDLVDLMYNSLAVGVYILPLKGIFSVGNGLKASTDSRHDGPSQWRYLLDSSKEFVKVWQWNIDVFHVGGKAMLWERRILEQDAAESIGFNHGSNEEKEH